MKLVIKEIIEYFDNGQLRIETTLINEKRNGQYIEYHQNGQLKIKTHYFNDCIVGRYQEYYENGNILTDTLLFETQNNKSPGLPENFKFKFYGKAHTEYFENTRVKIEIGRPELRTYKTYYKNGQLKLNTQIHNDVLCVGIEQFIGNYESFFMNGQLKIRTAYSNSLLNGLYEEYYENGNLKIKAKYVNGRISETYNEYFEDGNLKIKKTAVSEMVNGIKVIKPHYFEYTRFYKNQKIKIRSIVKEYGWGGVSKKRGIKMVHYKPEWVFEGPYKEYFKNGNIKIDTQFQYHTIFGIYKEYFKNKQLKIRAEYGKFGKEGNYSEYYSSGILKIKTTYLSDYIKGAFKKFYDNGQIEINAFYLIEKVNCREGFINLYDIANYKDGLYEEFNKDGTLRKSINFINGIEN